MSEWDDDDIEWGEGGDVFVDDFAEYVGDTGPDDDFDADIESNFEDWDADDWDLIAEEYEDIEVFEWFSELS